jgi:transcription antitermination factor NusG
MFLAKTGEVATSTAESVSFSFSGKSPRVTHMAAACAVLPVHAPAMFWYALRARPAHIQTLQEKLTEAGFETFVATYTETTRWSDRSKTVERQAIPGYLFVSVANVNELHEAAHFPGVLQVLPTLTQPEPIDQTEIASLRQTLASRIPAAPCAYVAGERVTIDAGPLAGVAGVVVRSEAETRVIVGIEMLGRAVSVAIDAADLKK